MMAGCPLFPSWGTCGKIHPAKGQNGVDYREARQGRELQQDEGHLDEQLTHLDDFCCLCCFGACVLILSGQ